ncbi:MAG: hypothetical protein JXA22_09045 [Candidatus Thermoplasmatota archaeon]|nr:hypothetical protein [Candidatus Thermoplasmatota archaeon]
MTPGRVGGIGKYEDLAISASDLHLPRDLPTQSEFLLLWATVVANLGPGGWCGSENNVHDQDWVRCPSLHRPSVSPLSSTAHYNDPHVIDPLSGVYGGPL